MPLQFGVSTSGFYDWEKRKSDVKRNSDSELLRWIKKIHRGRRRCYGSPRVYRLLRRIGVVCSRCRVARVMGDNGTKATSVDLYYYNPKRRDHYQRVENHLAKQTAPTGVSQQWVADFTYLKTRSQQWVYLATVMDLYSRRVIGWSISEVRDSALTKGSLDMALKTRKPLEGAIFHTDQGIEYAANAFQEALSMSNLKASMSGKGRCLDNATAESFFTPLKLNLTTRDGSPI